MQRSELRSLHSNASARRRRSGFDAASGPLEYSAHRTVRHHPRTRLGATAHEDGDRRRGRFLPSSHPVRGGARVAPRHDGHPPPGGSRLRAPHPPPGRLRPASRLHQKHRHISRSSPSPGKRSARASRTRSSSRTTTSSPRRRLRTSASSASARSCGRPRRRSTGSPGN